MKKIRVLLILTFMLLIATPMVMASSATINVTSSRKTVTIGNTVSVTVKVQSSDLGSWEYCISYDSSILKLTNSTADANTCVKAGVVTSLGQKSSTETFTFKAIKSGTSKVTVKSYAVYAYSDEEQIKTTASSVSIKAMTQAELEATYSKNAYLKSLKVGNYELTPKFDKDTLEYSVEVENDVEKISVSATKADSTASINGTGEFDLTEGNNRFEILVTAQKGNSLTYVVNVYRKELDPISVTIDNKNYTIVRKEDSLPIYPTFTLTTVDYEGTIIPAYYSEITDMTIIGLKDEDGTIKMYIYEAAITDEYREIKSNSLTVYPLDLPENDKLKNYIKKEINFNGNKINAYLLNEDMKQAIIYAQNVETGKKEYYLYDIEENSIMKYRSELDEYYQQQLEKYKYVIFGFIIGVVLLIFIIIIIAKPKKKKQNIVEVKVEEEQPKQTKRGRKPKVEEP